MPFAKGQSGNPAGANVHKGKSPTANYVDEPEAPQMLRDMRWVYAKGVLPAGATAGQKAVKMLLEEDAPRFLATLERLESEWAEQKRQKAQQNLSSLPGEVPSQEVRLDENSKRAVELIDRWLAEHRRKAEEPHQPSLSGERATTGLARDR